MTENGTEAPRRTTMGQVAMALASKEPLGKSETGRISAATTGSLAGQFFPDVNLARDPDETMDQFVTRLDVAFVALFKKCLVYNNPEYRDELLREALQEIRGGAS